MEPYTVLFVCLIFVSGIDFGQACNGYKLAIKKIENCGGPDQIVKIDEPATASFDAECNVIMNGCSSTGAFDTATITYTIEKNGNKVMGGNADMCAELEKKDAQMATAMMAYGLPDKCPVAAMEKCAKDTKISIAKHKSMLALARGLIKLNLDMETNAGKACFKITVEITK